jgi:hypothetical protein
MRTHPTQQQRSARGATRATRTQRHSLRNPASVCSLSPLARCSHAAGGCRLDGSDGDAEQPHSSTTQQRTGRRRDRRERRRTTTTHVRASLCMRVLSLCTCFACVRGVAPALPLRSAASSTALVTSTQVLAVLRCTTHARIATTPSDARQRTQTLRIKLTRNARTQWCRGGRRCAGQRRPAREARAARAVPLRRAANRRGRPQYARRGLLSGFGRCL